MIVVSGKEKKKLLMIIFFESDWAEIAPSLLTLIKKSQLCMFRVKNFRSERRFLTLLHSLGNAFLVTGLK